MLKKLNDAAKAVLKLREEQHSLAEEVDAYLKLTDAVNAADVELKAQRKASRASTKKA